MLGTGAPLPLTLPLARAGAHTLSLSLARGRFSSLLTHTHTHTHTLGRCWAQFCNPCGRMARSFFTDKFKLLDPDGAEVSWEDGKPFAGELGRNGKYGVTRTGALSHTHKHTHTLSPSLSLSLSFTQYGETRAEVGETVFGDAPLMNVRSTEWNELVTSMDFITWMRASILPRAKKLYRVIPQGLPAGTYTMQIRNNYDPLIFDQGIKVRSTARALSLCLTHSRTHASMHSLNLLLCVSAALRPCDSVCQVLRALDRPRNARWQERSARLGVHRGRCDLPANGDGVCVAPPHTRPSRR